VTIKGTGLWYDKNETVVKFGLVELTGDDLDMVAKDKIRVKTPSSFLGIPVAVSVSTPRGTSNAVEFVYIADNTPIEFESGLVHSIDSPTAVEFGPVRNARPGTRKCKALPNKLTLLASFK